MLARKLSGFVSLMIVAGLAIGCGGSMDESDSGAMHAAASGPEVLQPLPGVDIARGTAVGQVVDAQGLLG